MARTLTNPLTGATQIKVVRQRVLQHDLDMYAAISGKPPGIEPAEQATERAIKVATAARARPWSAAVLATYLGNLAMPKLATRVVRPEVKKWMRRVSFQALERIQEAQDRLATSRRTYPGKDRRP